MSAILVWGAGAIGGSIGAALARAGHDVLFVDRAADHVAAINRSGLEITGPIDRYTVRARARTPEQVEGTFETVLLCVKAQDTEAAARSAGASSGAGRRRGLGPERAERAGDRRDRRRGAHDRLLRQFRRRLPWARAWCMYGGRGAVVVGELDGRRSSAHRGDPPRCSAPSMPMRS